MPGPAIVLVCPVGSAGHFSQHGDLSSLIFSMEVPVLTPVFKKVLLILALAATFSGGTASAREVDQATIARLSQNWLAQKATTDKTTRTIRDISRIADAPAGITAYVVRLKPHGHIVFMGDTRLPPILAFSLTNDINLSPGPRNGFRALLLQDLQQLKQNLDMAADPQSLPASPASRKFIEKNERSWQGLLRQPESGAAPNRAKPQLHGGK
jgi:hypothetical protein